MPFDGEIFDGVAVASSVEQTPDPKATLKELYRVLKPGGRIRIMYEDLDRLLRPVVERTVKTAAAPEENPPITAVK